MVQAFVIRSDFISQCGSRSLRLRSRKIPNNQKTRHRGSRMKRTLTAIAALALTAAATGARAQDNCDPGKPGAELSGAEAETVYNCIAEELHAGYAQGDKRWIP